MALSIWKPGLLSLKKLDNKIYIRRWGLADVFLVLGFGAAAAFFSRAFTYTRSDLASTITVAIISLLLRIILEIWLFNNKNANKAPDEAKALFVLVSLVAPMSFAAMGIYLLSGQFFYQSVSGWLLEVGALLGILSIGISFIGGGKGLSQLLFGVWLMVWGLLLPLHLQMVGSNLLTYPFALWLSLLGIVAAIVIATDRLEKRFYLKYAAASLGLVTPAFLAFANRPYLVAHHLGLGGAFSAQKYGWFIVAGLVACIVLAAYRFRRFAKLPTKLSAKP